LLVARDRDVAPLPSRDALLQGSVVEHATAPHDMLKFPLLRGSGAELLLVGLAARRQFAHARSFHPGSTKAVAHQDVWLRGQPPNALLTAWAQPQRLAAGSFCQMPRELLDELGAVLLRTT